MEIRKAELKDLKHIQNLNNQLFDLEIECSDVNLIKNWPLSIEGKEYFENAIKNDFVIVAVKNELVIGYLLGVQNKISYYDFTIAELCNMCIDKNYRKQGIGFELYKQFKKHFESLNIYKFCVTASFKNQSAINFYKKIGFIESEITLKNF